MYPHVTSARIRRAGLPPSAIAAVALGLAIAPTYAPATDPASGARALRTAGAVQYVKSDLGNDTNDGQSWENAKKTLLGAYDALPASGGTIHFADGAWVGGEVPNQGLWFIGNNDPQWPTVPRGFRAQKPVHFVGVSGKVQTQFGRPAAAQIVGGHGEGWARDRAKPGIHLAGTFNPMVFENLAIVGATRAALLGVQADKSSRAASMVATQWFMNCQFSVGSGAHDSGIDGPVVDIGYAFWIYFDDSVLLAYATKDGSLDIGDDRHQAVVITDSGLQWFRRGRWAQGGIKTYVPGMSVEDITVESYGPALPPVVWVKNYTCGAAGSSYVYVRNVNRADNASGIYPDVLVQSSGNFSPDCVLVEGSVSSVRGPAIIMGQNLARGGVSAPFKNPNSPTNGQNGFSNGRVWARQENVRRSFTPTVVLAANHAKDGPPISSGSFTVTPNVAGPDGRNKAYRIAVSAGGDHQGFSIHNDFSVRPAVGDRIYIGAWVRLPSGWYNYGGPTGSLIGGFGAATATLNGAANYLVAPMPNPGDGNWTWVWAQGTVTQSNGTLTGVTLQVYVGQHYPVEVYLPISLYVPDGTYSDNEWGEIVEALSSWAPSAPVGSRAMTGDLALTDGRIQMKGHYFDTGTSAPASGTWARGDVVFNSSAAAGGPMGWMCVSGGAPGIWKAMPNLAP